MLSDSIARALAIPANRATRSLKDVEHIVVLMQENRSFDHYYGVMRGVRGFGDPHPVTLPSGQPVWYQADGATVVPPFRPDVGNLALTFIEDLDHSWDGTHKMFNGGNWDQWLPAKTTTCMAHMERSDLPFHYALADAFTVCDGYHCSMLGPTDTNRYYMWTGWDGNDGRDGGPVIANDELGYGWQTYPERLQEAGISWKIYQDIGEGLDKAGVWGFTADPYIGNYGDNSLLYFFNYQNAAPGSPLYQRARTGTDVNQSGGFFDILAADVKHGQLPSVSWIVAPEAYTEHPAWPAGYGAWYTAGVLNALTSDPEVWSKTALLITFDENDGFFDHVVGPYPNVGGLAGQSTVPLDNELFNGTAGTPGRLRTGSSALTVWASACRCSSSRRGAQGGWVCSETFDHTSLIRFIEARFGVDEPNITPWRRAVCGDLTSAFDFESASDRVPPLPSVAAYKPNQSTTPPSYHPDAAGERIGPDPGAGRAAVAPARLPASTSASTPGRDAQPRGQEPRPARRGPAGAIADGGRRAVQRTRSAPATRSAVGAAEPGHLRPQRPRSERLLPPLRGLSRDGVAGRGGDRRTTSDGSDAAAHRRRRRPPQHRSSSTSPTRMAPTVRSGCTARKRSRSTPATPAAGTTSR